MIKCKICNKRVATKLIVFITSQKECKEKIKEELFLCRHCLFNLDIYITSGGFAAFMDSTRKEEASMKHNTKVLIVNKPKRPEDN